MYISTVSSVCQEVFYGISEKKKTGVIRAIYNCYLSKCRPKLLDYQKNVRFTAQKASRVRIFSKKTYKNKIFRKYSHKIRTLLKICAENDGIILKWICLLAKVVRTFQLIRLCGMFMLLSMLQSPLSPTKGPVIISRRVDGNLPAAFR